MFVPILFIVLSRGFHLVHRDLGILVDSCAAVESSGTWLPSRLSPGWLEAMLPSPPGVGVGRSASGTLFEAYKYFLEY